MDTETLIKELEKLNLKEIEIIKKLINNPQEYFLNKKVKMNSPNSLMKYLTKALDQLAIYIDHNKIAVKEDPDLKFKWEKAMVSYAQLQKSLKELRSRHDYDGFWNRLLGKNGKFN
jgi:hypothetical protein